MMWFTKTPGIDGRLRQRIEDFIAEEIPKPLEPGDEHTAFWLEKFNWDGNRALGAIAKSLHLSPKRLGVAGTKDRRAVTRQRVTAWKVPAEQLQKIQIRGLKLYDFELVGQRLNLGWLEGNRFIIIIRDIALTPEETKERLESVFKELEKGIPNLFGPQRFGIVRKVTAPVGRALLRGDFQTAVKTYIAQAFEGEQEEVKKARQELWNNWGKKEAYLAALRALPLELRWERMMLDYLIKYPNDYAGAFRRLPKRLRRLFLNALQAEFFNRAVELEIATGGKLKQQIIPLPGFDTKFDMKNPIQTKITGIMEEEGVKLEHFKLPTMPELAMSGSQRELLLVPKGLKAVEIIKDEFNEGKLAAKIAFELPSGAFATTVLAEIMKVESAEE